MADKYSTDPIRIGEGRLAFPSLFQKAVNRKTGLETRYETTLLLKPDYDTQPILDMLWEAWFLRWGKDEKKWPKGTRLNPPRMPEDVIRDAAERSKYAGFAEGWKFISAGTNFPPTVRDGTKPKVWEEGNQRFPLVTEEQAAEAYAGRWAFITANAYTFQNEGVGVTLGLDTVLLRKADTNLAGGGKARSNAAYDDIAEVLEESALD